MRFVAIALLPWLLLSCAAGGLVPDRQSMPAARAALLPEYRIFYDSLQDYGDWVLIEPYGYVFRPHVNIVAWQPYQDGFWAPTDAYGWTWISSEPFGWATYHYGNWFYDPYQNWVWVPGADWGPGWVTWNANDTYVGWAPQLAAGGSYGSIPNGGFNYIPVSQLGSTNLASKIVKAGAPAADLGGMRPVENVATVQGIRINRGPDLNWVESKAGSLPRVHIDDLVAPGDLASFKAHEESQGGGRGPGKPPTGLRPVASPDSTRDAAEQAASEARAIRDRGSIGAHVPLVRPFGVGHHNPAPADHTTHAPHGPARARRDSTRVE